MTKAIVTAALAAALLSATGASAATLRAEALVRDENIRLSDLFDGTGSLGSTVITRAPAPGRKMVFDAGMLTQVANAYRLDWRAGNAFDRSVVERAAATISTDRIVEALKQGLQTKMPGERFTVELESRNLEINLAAEAPDTLSLDNLYYQSSDNRFSATLVAAAGTSFAHRISVSGKVSKTAEIPVLNRRLGTTEVISSRDISWIDVRADQLSGDVATSADQLIGRAPRRAIGENAPIRVRDVQAPVVVKRGDMVTMTLKTPAMVLTAQGRALADGAAGDTVRVINTGSSRTVEATVSGPNQVTVMTASATLAR